jgi:hypothetical protein
MVASGAHSGNGAACKTADAVGQQPLLAACHRQVAHDSLCELQGRGAFCAHRLTLLPSASRRGHGFPFEVGTGDEPSELFFQQAGNLPFYA